MLFSSITFLFVFLPIVCLLYFVTTKKILRNMILLIASLVFYAWANTNYLWIILSVIVINYLGGILIDVFGENKRIKQLSLFVAIFANLGFLIYFKYFNFILININKILHFDIEILNIILPIGISFYIFQAMSYIIDIYRGDSKVQKNFLKFALYISLFPQLIAGPIIKYHDIENQIDNREETFEKVVLGTKRFIIGLSKKIIIANTLGTVADKIFIQSPDAFSPLIAWLGAICYSLQLFFDFSGYSDMAIGLGLIFGFKFIENFNYPYISKSITEFWRRWHISLSTWFKNYLYIPLGGNKSGLIKTIRNLLIVFLLTGLWHGAAWNFIIWGIWNAIFIIIEKILHIGSKNEFSICQQWSPKLLIRHFYTILIFIIGWVIFRSDNISYAFKYIQNMFGLLEIHDELYPFLHYAERFEIIILVIAIFCSTPLFSNSLKIQNNNKFLRIAANIWLIFLLLFSIVFISGATYNPFLYFRF